VFDNVDIRQVIVSFVAIVMSITVHEFAHAITADRLGDDTPRRHGRISLNPMVMFRAHPFGTLVVPLIGAFTGFLAGWAATPVNPTRVRRGISVRRADIMITAAGPISNVLFGLFSLVLYGGFLALQVHGGLSWIQPLVSLSGTLVLANAFLAVFNMLPVAPLDGFGIVKAYTGGEGRIVRFLERYGMLILLVIIVKGSVIFTPVIQAVGAAIRAVQGVVL